MYLIYVDEYGTSGGRLDNPEEPYFALTACIVDEKNWNKLESDILALQRKAIQELTNLGNPPQERFEFHAAEMLQGKKAFKGLPIESQIYYAEELLKIAANNQVKYISIGIAKRILLDQFGLELFLQDEQPNELANIHTLVRARSSPYSISFCSILAMLNMWLTSQIDRGILIFDEHSQYGGLGALGSYSRSRISNQSISNIMAAPFYSDSKVHLPLQVADLVSYLLGREAVAALKRRPVKPSLITKWIDTYYEPFDFGATLELESKEISELSLDIVEEMWPYFNANPAMEDYCRQITEVIYNSFTMTGHIYRSPKNIGDETP